MRLPHAWLSEHAYGCAVAGDGARSALGVG
jgi:hypothetical protein